MTAQLHLGADSLESDPNHPPTLFFDDDLDSDGAIIQLIALIRDL